MTQKIAKGMSDMCNLSQGVLEKGIAIGLAKAYDEGYAEGFNEGFTKGVLQCIKGLMKNTGVSIEQAMSLLGVPEAEHQKYTELLENQ